MKFITTLNLFQYEISLKREFDSKQNKVLGMDVVVISVFWIKSRLRDDLSLFVMYFYFFNHSISS